MAKNFLRVSVTPAFRPSSLRIVPKLHELRQVDSGEHKDSKSWDRMLLACLRGRVFISRRGAEARSLGFEGNRPLSPAWSEGIAATAWRSGRRSPSRLRRRGGSAASASRLPRRGEPTRGQGRAAPGREASPTSLAWVCGIPPRGARARPYRRPATAHRLSA